MKVNHLLCVAGVLLLPAAVSLTWIVATPPDPFPMVMFTLNVIGLWRGVEGVGVAIEGITILVVEEVGEGGGIETEAMRTRIRRFLLG